jgi:hypothetical protein
MGEISVAVFPLVARMMIMVPNIPFESILYLTGHHINSIQLCTMPNHWRRSFSVWLVYHESYFFFHTARTQINDKLYISLSYPKPFNFLLSQYAPCHGSMI